MCRSLFEVISTRHSPLNRRRERRLAARRNGGGRDYGRKGQGIPVGGNRRSESPPLALQPPFIRRFSRCPHVWHSLTRYGSRENCALSAAAFSVLIWIVTRWAVSRPQTSQGSVRPVGESPVVAIPSPTSPRRIINPNGCSDRFRGTAEGLLVERSHSPEDRLSPPLSFLFQIKGRKPNFRQRESPVPTDRNLAA
jgi:hypothetical protein